MKFAKSRELKQVEPIKPRALDRIREIPLLTAPKVQMKKGSDLKGPIDTGYFKLKEGIEPKTIIIRNFDRVWNVNNVLPPDPNGEAGINYYFQIVNLSFAIFDKLTGSIVYGPADNSTIWEDLPGPWSGTNDFV